MNIDLFGAGLKAQVPGSGAKMAKEYTVEERDAEMSCAQFPRDT